MKRRVHNLNDPKQSGHHPDRPAPPARAQPARPLTPRRRLLIVLAVLFAAWMAVLLVLYFTTILPPHNAPPATGVAALQRF